MPEKRVMNEHNEAAAVDKLQRIVRKASGVVDKRNGRVSKISKHPDRDKIDFAIISAMTYKRMMEKWPELSCDNIIRRKRQLRPAIQEGEQIVKEERRSDVKSKLDDMYEIAVGAAKKADLKSNYEGISSMLDKATKTVELQMDVEGLGQQGPIAQDSAAVDQVRTIISNVIAIPKLPGVELRGKPFIEVSEEEYEIAEDVGE